MGEDQTNIPTPEQVNLPRPPSERDLNLFRTLLNQEALDFLTNDQPFELQVQDPKNLSIQSKFLFNHLGRQVEIHLRNNDTVDIHFANEQEPDGPKGKAADKYLKKRDANEFGESIKFLRFMDQFLGTIRRDAPLRFRTADEQRHRIFEKAIAKHGFTNTEIDHFQLDSQDS